MSNVNSSTRYIGSPEAYLKVTNSQLPDTDMADAIGCVLARARATVTLLQVQLEDGESVLSSDVMADALWAVEGYLDQLHILTVNSSIRPKEG